MENVDTLGQQLTQIKQRAKLREQNAELSLQIEELQKRVSRLIKQRIIINSEIEAITNDLQSLAGER